MSTNLENELRTRIEAFANDITAILQRAVATSVADALKVGPGRAGSAAAKGRAARGQARSAAQDGAARAALLREIQRKGGRRMEELSKAMRTPSKVLRGSIKALLADKKIKTTGQARGTKYFAS